MIDENRLIEVIEKILGIQIDEQPKVNEWIPIEERLLELAGYRCLATIENKYG